MWQLKNRISIMAFTIFLVALLNLANTNSQAVELDELRKEYKQAHSKFAKTQDYGKDYRESIETSHQLISALFNYWITLPEDSAKFPIICNEIKTLLKGTAGSPLTERHNGEKSFLARAVWPILSEKDLTKKQAAFIVKLSKPQMSVRIYDKLARLGKSTEVLGWDVQAAYALALIRSGNDKKARNEISNLQRKVSINRKANPRGSLDYGHSAGDRRYRNYTDYLQLCEVLHALNFIILGNRESAVRHIETAQKLRRTFSPQSIALSTEVKQRISMIKD